MARLKFLVPDGQRMRVPVTVESLAHEGTNFAQRVDDIININILDFQNVGVRACVCV